MRHFLTASVLALGFAGLAHAQTSTESTTTQTTTPGYAPPPPAYVAPPVAPPPGTLSTERETHSVDAYGNRVDSQSSSYRDPQGVAQDRQTTVTSAPPPPPPPVTTSTTTTQSTTSTPN